MKTYMQLLRVHHYLKNGLIFLPLLFSGNLFQVQLLIETLVGYISFCLIASSIYIYNDIQDIEKDKLHPLKKNRPIASGKISKKKAIGIGCVIFFLALLMNFSISFTSGLILVSPNISPVSPSIAHKL